MLAKASREFEACVELTNTWDDFMGALSRGHMALAPWCATSVSAALCGLPNSAPATRIWKGVLCWANLVAAGLCLVCSGTKRAISWYVLDYRYTLTAVLQFRSSQRSVFCHCLLHATPPQCVDLVAMML